MRIPTLIIVLLLISGFASVAAQDSEFFRSRLGEPSRVFDEHSELYQQKSGVNVSINYDDEGEVCSVGISERPSGRSTFQRLIAVANELVPSSMRGTMIGTTSERGNCTDARYVDYERAFVIYNQNACYGQGVSVLFKRRSCPTPPMVPGLARSFSLGRSRTKCAAAPFKSSLEEILGLPIQGLPDPKGYFRFTKNNASFLVRYGGGYRVNDLVISSSEGIRQITRLLDQIVPQSNRGKFLQREPAKIRRQRGETYLEKYECLSIEYSEEYGAENSGYASVNVTWN